MKSLFHALLLIGFALAIIYPATKPLFQAEFFQVHDYTHVARLAEMDLALKDGHFPVRWSKNFGYGYGMPLFNFYGPLPYYLAEVFHIFGFSLVASIKMIIYLSFLGSFVGMYVLAKTYWGSLGGLLSATAVIYAPYRAVDAYVRGSINELFGITFTILALACVAKWLATKEKSWFLAGSISIFGLITSHNVTALMAIPAILIFGLVEIVNRESRPARNATQSCVGGTVNRVVGMLAMLFLGIGLSASYSLPAFAEKSNTAISAITSGYFDFRQHFLYLRQFLNSPWGYGGSIFGLEDGLSFEIGKIHLLLAGLAGLLLLPKFKTAKNVKQIMVVSAGIVIASMLMATFKTQFIWENIPLLSFIQFPWRFLSLIIIFVSLLAGGAVMVLANRSYNRIPITIACILTLILYNHNVFKPEKFLQNADDLYYSDSEKIQTVMSHTLPDYMPPNVANDQTPPPARFTLTSHDQTSPLTETIINRTHEFLVIVPLQSASLFTANIFAFPGWRFFVNDQPVEPEIAQDLPIYTIFLDPARLGTGPVYLSGYLSDTPVRQTGNITSLLSAGIVVYVSAKNRMSKIYG